MCDGSGHLKKNFEAKLKTLVSDGKHKLARRIARWWLRLVKRAEKAHPDDEVQRKVSQIESE